MKKFLRVITLSVCVLCYVTGAAQDAKLARANKKFNQLAYIDAIEIYKDLVAKGFITADNDYYTLSDKATLGDKQENVARQNHHDGDATDTQL